MAEPMLALQHLCLNAALWMRRSTGSSSFMIKIGFVKVCFEGSVDKMGVFGWLAVCWLKRSVWSFSGAKLHPDVMSMVLNHKQPNGDYGLISSTKGPMGHWH